jgi:hypothetical protein
LELSNLFYFTRRKLGRLYLVSLPFPSQYPNYKCAFNTQVCPLLKFTYANIHSGFSPACEQLNSWIGGFQSIPNQIAPNNFKWYLHALLFIHTQQFIKRQMDKVEEEEEEEEEDDNDEGIDIKEEE